MTTLLIAVLVALAFGISMEAHFRVPRCFAANGVIQIGRLRLGVIVYRPCRCYARVGVA
jgi:hypothetical protein